MVSYKEAFEKSLEYFNGDELAAQVFLDKYALKDPSGELLEKIPEDMHKRLAKEFARIESKYPNPLTEKEIFDFLKNFKRGVAQGSPMAGIGNPYQIMSISNCFVIDVGDSYGWILKSDQELAHIFKRRGGCGLDISAIRPKGLSTTNAAKTTDGIGVFMERFSNTTREVATQGRRAALMQTCSVHHPEIETFINIKRDKKKVTGANVSIFMTDEFMEAVKNDTEYEQRWPVDAIEPKITRKVKARDIWKQIVQSNWEGAEPGILFKNTIVKNSPADCYEEFRTISTNPCSEIPLSSGDACRLFLINTTGYVKNPYTKDAQFDYEFFAKDAQIAQRLMDDIVDLEIECIDRILEKVNSDPEPYDVKKIEIDLWEKIKQACMNGRRTGLGDTGIGDTVASLGLRYGSDESIAFVEELYKTLAINSYKSSIIIAKERGAFPVYDFEKEKDNLYLNRLWKEDKELYEDYKKYGRRNIACLTTAPCGSVSLLTQTTSGIEPAFRLSYTRRKKINSSDKNVRVDYTDDLGDSWQEFKIFHHGFKKWMELNNKTEKDIEQSPYWKSTSDDLDWLSGVRLQAGAQKFVDHAISKTTNLPNSATQEQISEIYIKAWELGLKGITIYRDGCRSGVLVSDEASAKQEVAKLKTNSASKRPKELSCQIHTMTVQKEKWTFFVGLMDGQPYEIFGGESRYISIPRRVKEGKIVKHNGAENPKARYDLHFDHDKGPDEETIVKDITSAFENATHSAFTRTLSLALRHNVPVQYVVEQLNKGSEKEDDLYSFSRAVERVLKSYILDGTKIKGKQCPECKSTDLRYQEGCMMCICGYSKCG